MAAAEAEEEDGRLEEVATAINITIEAGGLVEADLIKTPMSL